MGKLQFLHGCQDRFEVTLLVLEDPHGQPLKYQGHVVQQYAVLGSDPTSLEENLFALLQLSSLEVSNGEEGEHFGVVVVEELSTAVFVLWRKKGEYLM